MSASGEAQSSAENRRKSESGKSLRTLFSEMNRRSEADALSATLCDNEAVDLDESIMSIFSEVLNAEGKGTTSHSTKPTSAAVLENKGEFFFVPWFLWIMPFSILSQPALSLFAGPDPDPCERHPICQNERKRSQSESSVSIITSSQWIVMIYEIALDHTRIYMNTIYFRIPSMKRHCEFARKVWTPPKDAFLRLSPPPLRTQPQCPAHPRARLTRRERKWLRLT